MFTFIDLFSGIGGMRLAAEAADGRCLFSSEIDKFARQTYAANFDEMPAGDIREVDAESLPDFDVLLAGFPCQPFSSAGVSKNKSLGRESGFADETRGTLFYEICRIIAAKRPRAFLLENVSNLVRHDGGWTMRVILHALAELGYHVQFDVLDASHYGVPQRRKRVYIVGFLRDPLTSPVILPPRRPAPLADVLEDEVDPKYTLSDKNWACRVRHLERSKAKGNGFGHGAVDINRPAPTLLARYYKDGGECLIPQDGKNPRRLTPREMARCFGFPESFQIVCSDTQAYKQFGNSVAVPLVTMIMRRIAVVLAQQQEEVA